MHDSLPSLGPYEPLERIGVGGMGEVWVARQSEPLERVVAVKVIKAGMDSGRVLARFETERQSLARMDHPNIARVFDAGLTAEGRPYFAMEFVRGLPITDYCDRHQLGSLARLELLLPVCEAIQHAHQRGVIHRDIKPSNVLVEVVEGRPLPKVIDFGVAKSTTVDLEDGPMVTEVGQLVGTPEYMSPEQADLTGANVDSRTDIYSLGVLLYELLTGVLPFDSAALRAGGITEIRRMLREVEPARPSTRITVDGAADAARQRGTTPSALRRHLRGDLDWIVLRALEKDRDRRYASASEFAEDIRRHLRDEPVLAGPPSASYRLGKFVRRHRAGVVTAAVAAGLILAGLVATGWQAVRATRAEAEARQQAAAARSVNEFLKGMLRQANPTENPESRSVTLLEVLDRASGDLEGSFDGSPEVEAELHSTIGAAYTELGRPEEAGRHYERALALAEGESRIDILRGAVSSDLRFVRLDSAQLRALEGIALAREHLDPSDLRDLRAHERLANVRTKQDRYADADSIYGEVIARLEQLPGEHEYLLVTWRSNHGLVLGDMGRFEEAIEAIEPSTRWYLEHEGEFNPDTGRAFMNLGQHLLQAGELDGAETALVQSVKSFEGGVGRNASYATASANLADVYRARGEFLRADSIYTEAAEITLAVLGPDNWDYAKQLSKRGSCRRSLGDLDGAEADFRTCLEIEFGLFGDDPRLFAAVNNLASVQRSRGGYAEAERLFRRARGYVIESNGREHFMVAVVTQNLAGTITDAGRPAEGGALYEEALGIAERTLPADHPNLAILRGNYGECLLRQGRLDEARLTLQAAWDGVTPKLGEGHPRAVRIAGWLVETCEAQGDAVAAAEWRARAS